MDMTVKEISDKYTVSIETVYSWFKRKNLPFKILNNIKIINSDDVDNYVYKKEIKNCLFCENPFSLKREGNIYCSSRCRENNWVKNNKERNKELQKKSRNKNHLVLCKMCKKPLPNNQRTMGRRYCVDCLPNRKKERNEKGKKISYEKRKKFKEYKESLGCTKCGYNKYGGSLDFHHIEGDEKERRIDALTWHSNSKVYKEEIVKCILLCKNCHHELHHGERENNKC